MLLQLVRYNSFDGATIGRLYLNHEDSVGSLQHICYTLEDEVREIPGKPVSEWKIKGKTAIPRGIYRITLENSPRFGAGTIALHGVEGFSYILIHAGNKIEDTSGCILVGLITKGNQILPGTSKPALINLKKLIKSALDAKEDVFIKVD